MRIKKGRNKEVVMTQQTISAWLLPVGCELCVFNEPIAKDNDVGHWIN